LVVDPDFELSVEDFLSDEDESVFFELLEESDDLVLDDSEESEDFESDLAEPESFESELDESLLEFARESFL